MPLSFAGKVFSLVLLVIICKYLDGDLSDCYSVEYLWQRSVPKHFEHFHKSRGTGAAKGFLCGGSWGGGGVEGERRYVEL